MQVKNINEVDFEKLVLHEKRPVLVDFYADWCGPCKMLSPVLEEAADEIGSNAVIYKVDIEKNQSLAANYNVLSIPHMTIFKNGKIDNTINGYQDKESIVQALR